MVGIEWSGEVANREIVGSDRVKAKEDCSKDLFDLFDL